MYKNFANNLFPINSHIIGGSEEDEDDNEMIDKKPIVKEEKKEDESESESEPEPEKPEGELVRIIKDCSYTKEYLLIFLLLMFIMILLLLYFTDIKEYIMEEKLNYVDGTNEKFYHQKRVFFNK